MSYIQRAKLMLQTVIKFEQVQQFSICSFFISLLFFKIYKRLSGVKICVCFSPRTLPWFLQAYGLTLTLAKYCSQKNSEKMQKSQQWFHNENDFNKHMFLFLFEESCTYTALCILQFLYQYVTIFSQGDDGVKTLFSSEITNSQFFSANAMSLKHC